VTFRFRIDPLLTLRRRQLDAARLRLASANEAVLHAGHLVEQAGRALSIADSGYRDALADGVDNDSLDRHRTWIDTQRSRLATQTRECAERQSSARDASHEAMLARRRVRMLEKLRDRAIKRHLAAVDRRDARELDAQAAMKYARRKIEEGQQ